MADTVTGCPHGDPLCRCAAVGSPTACHIDYVVVGHECPNQPDFAVAEDALAHCHVEGCNWRAETPNECNGVCGLKLLGLVPVLDGGVHSMTQAAPGTPLWACGWLRTPLNVGWKAGYLTEPELPADTPRP